MLRLDILKQRILVKLGRKGGKETAKRGPESFWLLRRGDEANSGLRREECPPSLAQLESYENRLQEGVSTINNSNGWNASRSIAAYFFRS
jgi:hypothetical protein